MMLNEVVLKALNKFFFIEINREFLKKTFSKFFRVLMSSESNCRVLIKLIFSLLWQNDALKIN